MSQARNVMPLFGRLLAWLAAAMLLAFLAVPILAIVLRVSPLELAARLGQPVVLAALRLSLVTTAASTAIVVLLGLPTAVLLAHRRSPLARAIETVVDLPMVLPPTVAGAGLLFAFGAGGPLGGLLLALGVSAPPSTAAVVMAQTFVAAPFFVTTMVAGLRAVEPRYAEVASTLRASPDAVFLRVLLPLATPSLLAGIAMSGTRAMAEFGATVTFAGNVPGVSQTLPSAVYAALQSDPQAAVALSVLTLVLSFVLLLGLRLLPTGLQSGKTHAARDAR